MVPFDKQSVTVVRQSRIGVDTSYEPPLRVGFGISDKTVDMANAVMGRTVLVPGAGPNPTRAGFRQALESLKSFDLGIGAPLTFGPERHQGLDNVYFTRVVNGRWAPITDWAAAVKA